MKKKDKCDSIKRLGSRILDKNRRDQRELQEMEAVQTRDITPDAGLDTKKTPLDLEDYVTFQEMIKFANQTNGLEVLGSFKKGNLQAPEKVGVANVLYQAFVKEVNQSYILTKTYRDIIKGWPLIDLEKLEAACVDSAFGKGEETVFDFSVRKSKECKVESIPDDVFYKMTLDGLTRNCQKIVRMYCPTANSKKLSLKPTKICVYGPGDHFKEHTDTLHAGNHVGTLVFQFPTRYSGGGLHVATETEYKRIPEGLQLVFMFAGCPHYVAPVEKGKRVTLQFDVYLKDCACYSDGFPNDVDFMWDVGMDQTGETEVHKHSSDTEQSDDDESEEKRPRYNFWGSYTRSQKQKNKKVVKKVPLLDPELEKKLMENEFPLDETPFAKDSKHASTQADIAKQISELTQDYHVGFVLSHKYALSATLGDLHGKDALLRDTMEKSHQIRLCPVFRVMTKWGDNYNYNQCFVPVEVVRKSVVAKRDYYNSFEKDRDMTPPGSPSVNDEGVEKEEDIAMLDKKEDTSMLDKNEDKKEEGDDDKKEEGDEDKKEDGDEDKKEDGDEENEDDDEENEDDDDGTRPKESWQWDIEERERNQSKDCEWRKIHVIHSKNRGCLVFERGYIEHTGNESQAGINTVVCQMLECKPRKVPNDGENKVQE